MFGKGGVFQEENLLRDIVRSIDKKLDYSAYSAQNQQEFCAPRQNQRHPYIVAVSDADQGNRSKAPIARRPRDRATSKST